jgi:dihydroorotase
VTAAPARILGLDAGHLAPGAVADVCIFDAARHVRISAEHLKSQGKNTPFIGYELPGRVKATLVAGKLVYEA